MKSICILVLFTISTALAKNVLSYKPEEAAYHFEKFVKTYNKNYDLPEKAKRFEIFSQNLEKINYLNKQSKYAVFGITQFTDLSPEEFKRRFTGYKKSNGTTNFALKNKKVINLTSKDVPDSFDWRDKGVVTPVKDQGQCGSCWAFSVIGNVESANAIKTKTPVILSEQQLVDCATACYGCQGGLLDEACEYLKSNGAMTGKSYPYSARDGTCQYQSDKVKVRLSNCTSLDSKEEELEESLINLGPLSIALDASVLQNYHGGIITGDSCSGYSVDHAVLLVGYGNGESDQKYWLVKNSWGQNWGESGYFRMERGKNCLSFLDSPQLAVSVQ